jgi:hypothetical protein
MPMAKDGISVHLALACPHRTLPAVCSGLLLLLYQVLLIQLAGIMHQVLMMSLAGIMHQVLMMSLAGIMHQVLMMSLAGIMHQLFLRAHLTSVTHPCKAHRALVPRTSTAAQRGPGYFTSTALKYWFPGQSTVLMY